MSEYPHYSTIMDDGAVLLVIYTDNGKITHLFDTFEEFKKRYERVVKRVSTK